MDIKEFRRRYCTSPPMRTLHGAEAELLGPDDGVRHLERAPVVGVVYGTPPGGNAESVARYLWVIDEMGIPYICERPLHRLEDALPKHTNLTGGSPAYVGGELWFVDKMSIYVSGGSGRYPPRSETQLDDAVSVFESYDYRVRSLGWDPMRGSARRYLVS